MQRRPLMPVACASRFCSAAFPGPPRWFVLPGDAMNEQAKAEPLGASKMAQEFSRIAAAVSANIGDISRMIEWLESAELSPAARDELQRENANLLKSLVDVHAAHLAYDEVLHRLANLLWARSAAPMKGR
jgi:hypothetical protein